MPENLDEVVEAWLPVLQRIPTERLQDCFLWAHQARQLLDGRDRNFPMSADDVGAAWYRIQEAEEAEARRKAMLVCVVCQGTREVTYYDRALGKDVTHPCLNPCHEREDYLKRKAEAEDGPIM